MSPPDCFNPHACVARGSGLCNSCTVRRFNATPEGRASRLRALAKARETMQGRDYSRPCDPLAAAQRRFEQLDRISRERVLTDDESERLERAIRTIDGSRSGAEHG